MKNLFSYCLGTFFRGAIWKTFRSILQARVHFSKPLSAVGPNSIVFFPVLSNTLCCGLAGILAFRKKGHSDLNADIDDFEQLVTNIESRQFELCRKNNLDLKDHYLGGSERMRRLLNLARSFKQTEAFFQLFQSSQNQAKISRIAGFVSGLIETENQELKKNMGHLKSHEVETMSGRIEHLKDVAWCLTIEITQNIEKVKSLLSKGPGEYGESRIKIFKMVNAVLNSLDRLEVRGRDSAGISLMFLIDQDRYGQLEKSLSRKHRQIFNSRREKEILLNGNIAVGRLDGGNGKKYVSISFTYKVAAEIGSLGDNIRFLRRQITNDPILHLIGALSNEYHSVCAHTRWASVGAITEANCHPVDNNGIGNDKPTGTIYASLNGDIDNFSELKAEHERNGGKIHEEITTDTKIIPVRIEHYLQKGAPIQEAFRLAVNDFKGSHAICMQSDLAPGKIFLAQRGSGQAIFVGLAEDHYMPASEVYGFVEETQHYLKLDGEKTIEGKNGPIHGQIFILDQDRGGGLDGIHSMYYDGTSLELSDKDIRQTQITSRDIDRQNFPHYFLKEISESPDSVEKTLLNRWKADPEDPDRYQVTLEESVFPEKIKRAFLEDRIKRIFLIGQGTAGVAAQACANIIAHYLDDPLVPISPMKASELSGFMIDDSDAPDSMDDCLVIAISQSGTTTDTNRAVDMLRRRGAHLLAIVNRRDSDITFKVDGVMYTSSGRDIEMSVASTKAFYSQIIAGALLGLFMAGLKKRRDSRFMTEEIKRLREIPNHMRTVLGLKEDIEKSARRLAVTKNYWAAVGSGPNKASSDEIRIKLSELCYKTISSDCVEDKKHIDLSSEPLIMVCAAGTRDTVIGDIVKDTAIFMAHKAVPVVIASEGESRFAGKAEDIFFVPSVAEHLAPILNTLVGHVWGYYAALSINENSRFLDTFRADIRQTLHSFTSKGMDTYEVILEKTFREKIVQFDNQFRQMIFKMRFPMAMGLSQTADLSLLLKYLSGKLPLTDFEIDFGIKGTPSNVINQLFETLGSSINAMARPVDAIKHQAKTVTVGTSRISERIETGILFDQLARHQFNLAQLTPNNIVVLRNVQPIIEEIKGAILYRIDGLDILGEITDNTTIEVVRKEGVLKPIPSRVESDTRLKGTKRIIVREKNVYIGKGRKDNRNILVIPITSSSHAKTNIIEYLMLLNVAFRENVPLAAKIKALGGKFERIKNIVQENSVKWHDNYLELVEMKELFGSSAEKIGEYIVSHQKL